MKVIFHQELHGLDSITGNSNKPVKYITALCQWHDSTFLILDGDKSRIQRFNKNGEYINTIGGPGSGPGEMLKPRSMKTFRDSIIYITDFNNGRHELLGRNEQYLRQINNFRYGDAFSRFAIGNNKEFIARTEKGDRNLLAIYDSLGNLIRKFGSYYEFGESEIETISANAMYIIIDKNNNIWCIYESLPIIRRYSFEGVFLEEIEITGYFVQRGWDNYDKNVRRKQAGGVSLAIFFKGVSLLPNNNLLITPNNDNITF